MSMVYFKSIIPRGEESVRLLIVLLFTLTLAGCSLTKTIQAPVDSAERSINAYQQAEQVVDVAKKTKTIELVIDFGDAKRSNSGAPPVEKYQYAYEDGATALSVLEQSGLTIEKKEFSFGTLIDSIDGVKGGIGGKYWIYYVNETMGNIAAEKFELKPGDKIEWKFDEDQGV